MPQTARAPLRVLAIGDEQVAELDALPPSMAGGGFVWIALTRDALGAQREALQSALQRLAGGQLVDLHVSDLLNAALPSHYEGTSWYDLLVFRRLATAPGALAEAAATLVPAPQPASGDGAGRGDGRAAAVAPAGASPRATAPIETHAVGFVVFDRVLVSVHPADCAVREYFASRLLARSGAGEQRGGPRLPPSPADLMLRMLNHMVDSYLELRRLLSRRLGELQQDLLHPKSRFADWQLLLDSRNELTLLEDTCEDQRAAVTEWIDALDEWPVEADPARRREHELLGVRSRDVLEHIERVLAHVRRLEHSAENAVQMHFSAIAHRTNGIMRTLTVLTAVFLPLNLITGFFGMNFDRLPLVHSARGLWVALALMVAIGAGFAVFFWRRRYIGSDGRR